MNWKEATTRHEALTRVMLDDWIEIQKEYRSMSMPREIEKGKRPGAPKKGK